MAIETSMSIFYGSIINVGVYKKHFNIFLINL